MKLNKLIEWESFRKYLKGFYKYEKEDLGGKRPYDPLKMLKATLLGQWHSLSDPKLEESLGVRLDFMLFTGFLDVYSSFRPYAEVLIDNLP